MICRIPFPEPNPVQPSNESNIFPGNRAQVNPESSLFGKKIEAAARRAGTDLGPREPGITPIRRSNLFIFSHLRRRSGESRPARKLFSAGRSGWNPG